MPFDIAAWQQDTEQTQTQADRERERFWGCSCTAFKPFYSETGLLWVPLLPYINSQWGLRLFQSQHDRFGTEWVFTCTIITEITPGVTLLASAAVALSRYTTALRGYCGAFRWLDTSVSKRDFWRIWDTLLWVSVSQWDLKSACRCPTGRWHSVQSWLLAELVRFISYYAG